MPYLPTGYTKMRTTEVSYDKAALVEPGDILITNDGPFGHAGIAYTPGDSIYANIAHIINTGLVMGSGATFPNNTRVYRYRNADTAFAAKITNTVRRMARAEPEYRLFGAIKSIGSSRYDKEARDRLLKYIHRPESCPKKMFCSEFVVLATQIAALAVPWGFFIYLDARSTWPSTLKEYLDKSAEWTFVGGWETNPERFGAS